MREQRSYELTDAKSTTNTAAFSNGWRAVARWNGFDTTIEVDEPIGLDPDPVSSSTEHAAVRQYIKHLRGVSS
jgi:hypothetical protein